MNDSSHSTYELRVEWGDCDPADIVYYPNYYRWFDNATHAMFEARGFGLKTVRNEHGSVGFPLVKAEAKFRSLSRVGDRLRIESSIIQITRKTLVVEHRVLKADELIAQGTEIRIFGVVDQSGRLSAEPVPQSLREAFGYQGED